MANNDRDKKKNGRRNHETAWAPYNFVPLQNSKELMVGELQSHDVYHGNSGYFIVTLTTETPTFVRGMLSPTEKVNSVESKDKPDFFSSKSAQPSIPGSSLRGMLRSLYEIVSFGKIHFVSDAQKMFFRAVAADKTDPLKNPYENIIGKFGRNVSAGYLHKNKGHWYIRPARKHGKEAYAKVKDKAKNGTVPVADVRHLKRFNNPDYELQYHAVAFETHGEIVTRVYTPEANEDVMAVLVCSGNMAETQGNGQAVNSPRKSYVLVLDPDPKAKPIPIDEQAIQDYIEGRSAFQKEKPFDESYGLLVEGRPVFYIDEGNHVIHFGHTPNFRVAPRIKDDDGLHAVTPLDRVPPRLRQENPTLDWTEAVFGYVSEEQTTRDPVAYAGRVSVTTATLLDGQSDYYERTITPKVLASPKPTTFQHYLEQSDGMNTETQRLSHYGDDTLIRGHKLYWRQMIDGIQEVEETKSDVSETQQTKMTPLKAGVKFQFRVYFDNLSDAELGVLAWVLGLGGDTKARHQIGMGKPLGMGVVNLEPTLYITDRRQRYRSLFNQDGTWNEAVRQAEMQPYIGAFKQAVKEMTSKAFDEHERIRQLQVILRQVKALPSFKYMEIEAGKDKINDYDGRPVLPRPSQIMKS